MPAAYSQLTEKGPTGAFKLQKIAVLMTDGIYNTVHGYSNGDYGSTAAQAGSTALDTCRAMRHPDRGITVYTIAFAAPADAKAKLLECAGGDTSKFYDAADGEDLRRAFRAIAEEINNLRLAS